MQAPLQPTPLYLPLRIIPHRKPRYALIGLQLFGGAILGVMIARQFSGDWHARAAGQSITFSLFTAFLIAGLAAVLWAITASLLRLIPDGPFFHIALSWDSIAIRTPFRSRRHAWSELGTFRVVTAPNDNEMTYIVAGAPSDEPGIHNDKDRYRRARFRLCSDPYCNPTDAELLARWLNEIRSAVAGRARADVAFFAPLALSANLVAGTNNTVSSQ